MFDKRVTTFAFEGALPTLPWSHRDTASALHSAGAGKHKLLQKNNKQGSTPGAHSMSTHPQAARTDMNLQSPWWLSLAWPRDHLPPAPPQQHTPLIQGKREGIFWHLIAISPWYTGLIALQGTLPCFKHQGLTSTRRVSLLQSYWVDLCNLSYD